MKPYSIPRQGDGSWIVTSEARMLPVSLRRSVTYGTPVPRPITSTRQRRPYSPTTMSLIPLSHRPMFYDP